MTGWTYEGAAGGPAVPLHAGGQAGDHLHVDGLPVAAIAAEVGTPCYIYSARVLETRVWALQQALPTHGVAIHYALKANSTLRVLAYLRSLGVRADANSLGEIQVALRAGFAPDELVFTGVGKARHELEQAIGLGVGVINAESPGELERIAGIAGALGRRARVALRVNPDIDAGTHPHISTGREHNKFGTAIDMAVPVLRDAARRPSLHVVGVHVHIGSQIRSLEPLARAASLMIDLAAHLRDVGIGLEHIDLGGGLGIPYDNGEAVDVAAYGRIVTDVQRTTGLAVVLEPGRWVVGPAGILVAQVIDVKTHPSGRRVVVLDAGMTELIRPALYNAYHHIVPVMVHADRDDTVCDIVGPVCESSDKFGVEREIAELRVDDHVAILDAGAYGAAMASNYNRRPLPAEVFVHDTTWTLVRRRQTVDDLLGLES